MYGPGGVRGLAIADPCHVKWNRFKAAVKHAGLLPIYLEANVTLGVRRSACVWVVKQPTSRSSGGLVHVIVCWLADAQACSNSLFSTSCYFASLAEGCSALWLLFRASALDIDMSQPFGERGHNLTEQRAAHIQTSILPYGASPYASPDALLAMLSHPFAHVALVLRGALYIGHLL